MDKPYKTIISLANMELDASLKDDLKCRITCDGNTKVSDVPFREVFCFDMGANVSHLSIMFTKGDLEIASSTVHVPASLNDQAEMEINEKLRLPVKNVSSDVSYLIAIFNLTFINTTKFHNSNGALVETKDPVPAPKAEKKTTSTAQAKKKEVVKKSNYNSAKADKPPTTKSSTVIKSQRSTTPTSNARVQASPKGDNLIKSRVSVSPSNPSKKVPAKTYQYSEDELHGYLNKVVNRHFDDAKAVVDHDLLPTGDCAYLNKFAKLTNSDLVNQEILSPAKAHGQGVTHEDFYKSEAGPDNLGDNASPTKLKEKYGSTSMHTRVQSQGGNMHKSLVGNKKNVTPDMTSILMDTETRRYVNEYKNQLEYLRVIIFNLDQKVVSLNTYKGQTALLQEEVGKSNDAREELRKSLLETTQNLREESGRFNRVISELEVHNKDILGSLKDSHNLIDQLQGDVHRNEIKIATLENENAELKLKNRNTGFFKAQLSTATSDFENAEKRHIDSLKRLSDRVRELENIGNAITAERDALGESKRDSELMNAELRRELVNERENNKNLSHSLSDLKRKLLINETSVDILEGVQAQRDAILADLAKVRTQNEGFIFQIEEMERTVMSKQRQMENDRSEKDKELAHLKLQIRDLGDQLNASRSDCNGVKKENVELKNHIITLEQLLCVKEDVYAQLQGCNTRLGVRNDDCDKLRGQIEVATKVSESQEDKIFELEKCLIYLKNVVQDKDDYVINLKKLILELKERAQVYIPLDDEIDTRLGEFINSSNDPAKLTKLFLREGEGVYSFGTKRVYVKMENGKIFIRVGGGFLGLEQFLKAHCNIELEKMAVRDPVNILQSNVAIQKVLAGRSVNEGPQKITPLSYKNALHSSGLQS